MVFSLSLTSPMLLSRCPGSVRSFGNISGSEHFTRRNRCLLWLPGDGPSKCLSHRMASQREFWHANRMVFFFWF